MTDIFPMTPSRENPARPVSPLQEREIDEPKATSPLPPNEQTLFVPEEEEYFFFEI